MPKYRSRFEENVGNTLGSDFEYESERHAYKISRKYTPDFINGDIWIEVKGYFRAGDVAKYKAIAEQYPEKTLIFVFSDPNKKVRKNAKMSMSQWADRNGWEWCTLSTVKDFAKGITTL